MSTHRSADSTPIQVDHLAYTTSRRHRREVHAAIRRFARKGRVGHLVAHHEADGSCCALAPWPTTAARIARELSADWLPAMAVAVVVADGEPA